MEFSHIGIVTRDKKEGETFQLLTKPLVAQPLFMNFDERGRLWVVQYRQRKLLIVLGAQDEPRALVGQRHFSFETPRFTGSLAAGR